MHVQLAGARTSTPIARVRKKPAPKSCRSPTQFYGDRTYRAKDPEGHIWTFGVTVRKMTSDDWDKAGGLVTKKRLD